MPFYEYVCRECEHKWELEQRITDAAVKECPECKRLEAKRLISGGTNFELLGAGWAKDLYVK